MPNALSLGTSYLQELLGMLAPHIWRIWRPRKLHTHSSSHWMGEGRPWPLLTCYQAPLGKRPWGHSVANTACSPHFFFCFSFFWIVGLCLWWGVVKGEKDGKGFLRLQQASLSLPRRSSPIGCVFLGHAIYHQGNVRKPQWVKCKGLGTPSHGFSLLWEPS